MGEKDGLVENPGYGFFYQPDGESEGGDEGGVGDGVGEEDDRCVDNGAILCQL